MSDVSLTFSPGDERWQKYRQRGINDLFFFSSVILGMSKVFPLEAETHLLYCRFLERKTGIPEIDSAPWQKCETPRGTGKTAVGTIADCLRMVCENPDLSILIANERQETADGFLGAIKTQIETNDLLRALYPELRQSELVTAPWAATKATVHRQTNRPEPTWFTIGVGGTVTGTHPDRIIIDDPISKEAMENARIGAWQIMEKVNRWCNEQKLLLNTQAKPFPWIRVNGTRWWKDDTYDYIEKTYGYKEQPKKFRLATTLPNGTIISRTVYRVGDVAVYRAGGLENGQAVYPKIYTLENMAKLQQDDPELFACLPAGERLLADSGPIPIEAVREGHKLWTREGRYGLVTAVNVRPYTGTLVRIAGYGQANPSALTGNHKVWIAPAGVRVGTRYGVCGDPEWVRADEVKCGDLMQVPIDMSECRVSGFEALEDFWYLVGHFLGDGNVGKSGAVAHYFNKRDTATAAKVQRIVQGLFGRKARIEEAKTVNRITYRHRWAADFFGPLSHGIAQKWLPAWCERLPLHLQKSLIAGYWDADGCVYPNGRRVAVSVCQRLLEQMQRILARLGQVGYMTRPKKNTAVILGRQVNTQPLYMLWIYPPAKRHPRAWIADGTLYRRVRRVSHERYSGPVFNCEVAEDHSYVGASNALTYSNCNILNNPTDAALRTFQDGWLRYWIQQDPRLCSYTTDEGGTRFVRTEDLLKVLIVDPAFTATGSGARAALVLIGTDTETGKHLVLEAKALRAGPEDLVDEVLNMAGNHNCHRVVIESVAQQIGWITMVQNTAVRRKLSLGVDVVKPGGRNKDVRIEGLTAYFRAGAVLIHPSQLDLIREYRAYTPGARYKDLLDALAYGPELWPNLQPGQSRARDQRAELAAYYARRGVAAPDTEDRSW